MNVESIEVVAKMDFVSSTLSTAPLKFKFITELSQRTKKWFLDSQPVQPANEYRPFNGLTILSGSTWLQNMLIIPQNVTVRRC